MKLLIIIILPCYYSHEYQTLLSQYSLLSSLKNINFVFIKKSITERIYLRFPRHTTIWRIKTLKLINGEIVDFKTPI